MKENEKIRMAQALQNLKNSHSTELPKNKDNQPFWFDTGHSPSSYIIKAPEGWELLSPFVRTSMEIHILGNKIHYITESRIGCVSENTYGLENGQKVTYLIFPDYANYALCCLILEELFIYFFNSRISFKRAYEDYTTKYTTFEGGTGV